jgi:FAD synthase
MKLKNLLSGKLGIGPCVLGIGTFDGVHLGHRQLVSDIIHYSRQHNLPSVIFTFDHSPRKFLSPRIFKGYLTTPEEKFSLLLGTGIDYVVFSLSIMLFDRWALLNSSKTHSSIKYRLRRVMVGSISDSGPDALATPDSQQRTGAQAAKMPHKFSQSC